MSNFGPTEAMSQTFIEIFMTYERQFGLVMMGLAGYIINIALPCQRSVRNGREYRFNGAKRYRTRGPRQFYTFIFRGGYLRTSSVYPDRGLFHQCHTFLRPRETLESNGVQGYISRLSTFEAEICKRLTGMLIHFRILTTKSNGATLLLEEPSILESESQSQDHYEPTFERRLQGIHVEPHRPEP